MNDTDGVTGIVLAGGRSRRLGRDKAVETIAGQALIARVLDSLSHVAQELVVVVNDRERARGTSPTRLGRHGCGHLPRHRLTWRHLHGPHGIQQPVGNRRGL